MRDSAAAEEEEEVEGCFFEELLSGIFVCSSLEVGTEAEELVAITTAVAALLWLAAASLVRLTGILCALCNSDEGAGTLVGLELELEPTAGNLTEDGSGGGALASPGADGLAEVLGVLAAAALYDPPPPDTEAAEGADAAASVMLPDQVEVRGIALLFADDDEDEGVLELAAGKGALS